MCINGGVMLRSYEIYLCEFHNLYRPQHINKVLGFSICANIFILRHNFKTQMLNPLRIHLYIVPALRSFGHSIPELKKFIN
jgi:hypothetical protein